ncbi:mitochondrial carrier domain-containing protein [Cercophora newfieldiana]|uniref:Mitochondrial carrier domain-containing protein n=1 Tax=Cercophora newfieldiana TaxID=92897 RepID=A0AA39YRQ2_9PEZI|nr:mitochondrial carrier domain-containing protein [Cercophora newfieldiana]
MAPFVRSAQHPDGQDHDRLVHDEPPVEITAWQKMLSATSGSLLTGLLVTPLDVVRVRWQSQGISQPQPINLQRLGMPTSIPNTFQPQNLGVTACCREVFFANNTSEVCLAGPRIGAAECAVEQTQQRTFNSTVDGLRKIARNEGITTLWRGLSPTLIMAVPANIIYFTGYEWLRYNPASPVQRAGLRDEYAPLVGGSIARILAATAVSPIELFRTRLQALSVATPSPGAAPAGRSGPLLETFRGIKDMVGLHGYPALWRGLTLTLWRDVPFSGMYWLGYETIRNKLTDARERARGRSIHLDSNGERHDSRTRAHARRRSRSRENHTETFTDSFIAGATSGAIASVATTPFDVGKTRTQVYREGPAAAKSSAAAAAPEERSMGRLLWHIFKTEGLPGLFKGWIPRTLKVAPACAIMISSYEVGKRAFRGVNERALVKAKEREIEELESLGA